MIATLACLAAFFLGGFCAKLLGELALRLLARVAARRSRYSTRVAPADPTP